MILVSIQTLILYLKNVGNRISIFEFEFFYTRLNFSKIQNSISRDLNLQWPWHLRCRMSLTSAVYRCADIAWQISTSGFIAHRNLTILQFWTVILHFPALIFGSIWNLQDIDRQATQLKIYHQNFWITSGLGTSGFFVSFRATLLPV